MTDLEKQKLGKTLSKKRADAAPKLAKEIAVAARRNAEQAMGLFFLGTVALDIVVAQVTFRSVLTIKTTRVRRSDIVYDGE